MVTCGGWGLASAPAREPTSSITCRLLSAATSHSRGCTWITGLFSRRLNLRLVWLKSVLNEPYIKPLEAVTVSPDLQTQGEPQTSRLFPEVKLLLDPNPDLTEPPAWPSPQTRCLLGGNGPSREDL